jgi:hypothetical protein
MKRIYMAMLAAGLAFAGLGFGLARANATPLGNAAAGFKVNAAKASAGSASVIQVHGCNHACLRGPVPEWGGVVSWHRHVGRFCRPIECIP